MDRGRPDRTGRTRPAGPRAADYHEPAARDEGCARGVGADAERRARRENRSRVTAASSSRPAGRKRLRSPIAPLRSISCATTTGLRLRCGAAGAIFVGSYTAQVAGDYAIGSNHVLPTNGAARFRGGLHTADFVRVSTDSADDAPGAEEPGADGHHAGARGRARGARAFDRGAACDDHTRRPADRAGALRLHLNENTGGCSQAVIDAIRADLRRGCRVLPGLLARSSRECAAYLGVSEAQLVLTNGLDEGLLALTVSAFRAMPASWQAARSHRSGAGVRDVLGVRQGGGRPRGVHPAQA